MTIPTEKKQNLLKKELIHLAIKAEDLIIKAITGQGKGGQKKNKTQNCIYIKHLPTGIEVKCQKTRSRETNLFLAKRQLCEKIKESKGFPTLKKIKCDKIRKQKKDEKKKVKKMTNIHWFPGHMAKTIKQLSHLTKQCDIIIELVDARIPQSSRNPEIKKFITSNHHHIIGLTKCDLADPIITSQWIAYLKKEMHHSIEFIIPQNKGIKHCLSYCKKISEEKRRKKPFYITKILICGIPNVGKSALINKCVKKKATIVQNKPGITKKTRGIMLDNHLELMDSPGILWPKIETKEKAIKLFLTNSIKETISDDYEPCKWLLSYITTTYPQALKRYHIASPLLDTLIESIGKNMHWLSKNNEINEEKTIRRIIEDFQKKRLGRITLETVEQNKLL